MSGFLPAETRRTALTRIQGTVSKIAPLSRKPLISLRRGRRPRCVATRTAVRALTASRHRRHHVFGAGADAGPAGGQRLEAGVKRTPSMPCTAMSPNNERFSRQNCGTLSELRWARAPNASRRAAFTAIIACGSAAICSTGWLRKFPRPCSSSLRRLGRLRSGSACWTIPRTVWTATSIIVLVVGYDVTQNALPRKSSQNLVRWLGLRRLRLSCLRAANAEQYGGARSYGKYPDPWTKRRVTPALMLKSGDGQRTGTSNSTPTRGPPAACFITGATARRWNGRAR